MTGYPAGPRSSLQLPSVLFHAYIWHENPDTSNLFLWREKKNSTSSSFGTSWILCAKLCATLSEAHSMLSERKKFLRRNFFLSFWEENVHDTFAHAAFWIALTQSSLSTVLMDHTTRPRRPPLSFCIQSLCLFFTLWFGSLWTNCIEQVTCIHIAYDV